MPATQRQPVDAAADCRAMPHLREHIISQFSCDTFQLFDAVLTLQGLPYDATTSMALVYGGLLAFMGVLISWAAPACNNPIFAEIVPPHLRNMIYSFDRSIFANTCIPT